MNTEDDFQKEYEQLYNNMIANPAEIEEEIEEVSSYVAEKLVCKERNVWCEFQDDIYKFKMTRGIKDWKEIFIIVALRYYDPDKKDNGKTYTIEIEFDKKLSEAENLKYGVKALFQHILGIIQPEELEE